MALALNPKRVEGRELRQIAALLELDDFAEDGYFPSGPGPDLTSGLAGTTAGGLAGGTGIGPGSGGPGNAGVGSAGANVGK
ncbi:hypothetical protein HaLaN_28512 [Haematococcus lacustris]|uniref:Uncharacterized protein n=1 Tax=Haematococcus lacustris TaxID=44745 RepID=A0A6A0AAG8_HAELA|nr:hypothetical protein HaLaN_28512 [Haematococcus lacustris]